MDFNYWNARYKTAISWKYTTTYTPYTRTPEGYICGGVISREAFEQHRIDTGKTYHTSDRNLVIRPSEANELEGFFEHTTRNYAESIDTVEKACLEEFIMTYTITDRGRLNEVLEGVHAPTLIRKLRALSQILALLKQLR